MKPLLVTFLWHMHQPYYKNVETNKFILPWVRLHAVKDYYDMVAILDKYPRIKQNFNLVPSLLLQLEEYLSGTTDHFMDLTLKDASKLSEDERVFVLFNFFMANWETMVYPNARYSFLLKKRGENTNPDEIKKIHARFTVEELRDLQVWFNLAWVDPYFDGLFPEIRKLKEKGERFTEDEKKMLIDTHMKIIAMTIPKYAEAAKSGRVELSTTPFYHPILPLVHDTETAKECLPGWSMDIRYSHPEDARAQVEKALSYFEKKFGARPSGMWPSEGSVSEPVLAMLAECGVKWAATDEEILRKSLQKSGDPDNLPHTIYKPYAFNRDGKEINMIFRNHYLSDLIGFSYQSWDAKEAAAHFIRELRNIKNSLNGEEGVVNVILDGENAWEYYPNDGRDFLEALYSALSECNDIETVTVSEAVARVHPKPYLKKIHPGSWINSDFYIWIGHEDDRKSWRLLARARADLVNWGSEHPGETEKLAKAWEEIYTGEGSDWNWWYGDDHSSKNDTEFDNLYRLHLMNVYKITGMQVPEEFFNPIAKGSTAFNIPPTRFIHPIIDGEFSHYYEWRGAGVYDVSGGGAMHRAETEIQDLLYGFDQENVYFKVDFKSPLTPGTLIEVKIADKDKSAVIQYDVASGTASSEGRDGLEACYKKFLEMKVPLKHVYWLAENNSIKFAISIVENGSKKETVPDKGYVHTLLPDRFFEAYNWKV